MATLSLHSLFELRSLLLNGTVSLDMAASSLEEIADITLDNMINCGALASDKKDQVKESKTLLYYISSSGEGSYAEKAPAPV